MLRSESQQAKIKGVFNLSGYVVAIVTEDDHGLVYQLIMVGNLLDSLFTYLSNNTGYQLKKNVKLMHNWMQEVT